MKQKAKERKLERRIAAWQSLKSTLREAKAVSRYNTGGYKCPGSWKGQA